jgi:hypothetical protein
MVRQMLLGAVAVAIAAGVSAQSAEPGAVRRTPLVNGTVVALSGQTLKLNTAEHGVVAILLSARTRIVEQKPASLAQVKSGEFIGTTAVQGADGKLHATEIHIFPAVLRGDGEGHHPMGAPATSMTNGNVESVAGSVTRAAGAAASERLRITYKGGQSQVEVPASVTVTLMSLADPRVLRPGVRVTVELAPGAHAGKGGLSAATVFVH